MLVLQCNNYNNDHTQHCFLLLYLYTWRRLFDYFYSAGRELKNDKTRATRIKYKIIKIKNRKREEEKEYLFREDKKERFEVDLEGMVAGGLDGRCNKLC